MMASESLWEDNRYYFSSQDSIWIFELLHTKTCSTKRPEKHMGFENATLLCSFNSHWQKTYLNCPTSMYSNCFRTKPMNTWNRKYLHEWAKFHQAKMSSCKNNFFFNLIWVQQAVVDSELHKLGEQVQYLSLQGHRGAGSILLQSFDHQRLEQTNVVVDGILEKQRGGYSFQNSSTSLNQMSNEKHTVTNICSLDVFLTCKSSRTTEAYLVPSVACCISNVGPQLVWSFLHYIKPSRRGKWRQVL